MPSVNLDIAHINEERRKAIAKSIKTITIEELRKQGEELFPLLDNPWRERYFQFLNENAGSTFYQARTNDRIEIFYCHARGKGMWFLPGTGMGPLQPKGLNALKEIVSNLH